MNGNEIEQIEKLFNAKIDPLVAGVKDLGIKSDKHYKKITVLETKFESVGNCADHKAEVASVKRDIGVVDEKTKSNSGRIWGLAIVLLVALLSLVANVVLKVYLG